MDRFSLALRLRAQARQLVHHNRLQPHWRNTAGPRHGHF
jgi:hypothetical protein